MLTAGTGNRTMRLPARGAGGRCPVLLNRQFVLPSVACRTPEQMPAAELDGTTRLTAVFWQYGV
jgi:hypothetical protein